MIFITAFFTGLLGSAHCAGMCGPIALAVPTAGNTLGEKILSKVVYNSGRIFTYSILGLLFGAFGTGLKLAGLQQSISIGAGIFIIAGVVISKIKPGLFSFNFVPGKFFGTLFTKRTFLSVFSIGVLNGLLPCGFVYIGIIGSLATQSMLNGMLFMVFFGLGTFPMMFGVGLAGQFISLNVRSSINKIIPYAAILIGCLFILRGMNLGIPYISPEIASDTATVKECCEPK